MRLLRRLVPELGFLTIAGFAWGHRGTLRRAVDLAADAPRLVREEGASGVAQHGRLLLRLDRELPTDLDVRISGVDAGSVTLAGDPGPEALARATAALRGVRGITDVRTDGTSHPTVDGSVPASAS